MDSIRGASVTPRSPSSWAISSRSTNFWILVPDIGHSETKRTYRGTLYVAIRPRQNSMSSASSSLHSGLELNEGGRHLAIARVGCAHHLNDVHGLVAGDEVFDLER